MRLYYVLQTGFVPEVPAQTVYEFLHPQASDQGHYRMTTALNAFFYSQNHRKNITVIRQFSLHHSFEELKYTLVSNVPIITLPSLYDFFEYVGYDRATKTYASGERIKKWSNAKSRFV